MKTRNQNVTGTTEAVRSEYRTPEVVSMNSADLLELLGPAQGYGGTPGTRGGESVNSGTGLPGFNKG